MIVTVRESEIGDVYRLAANLRADDAAEITGLDLDPTIVIRTSFRSAVWRRTAFVDGEIAAMWGLGGVLLSDEGAPWLLTTPAAERVPVTFVKLARANVAEMMRDRRLLSNVVAASYVRACRLLALLGFTLDPPQPMGARGVLYQRFWMTR